jgi:hypothetical protein
MIVTLAVVTLALVAVFDRNAPARPRQRHDHPIPPHPFPSQRSPSWSDESASQPLSGKGTSQSDQPG